MPDILADIQHDGIPLEEVVRKLDEAGKEAPSESPTESNQAEEAPSSQGAEEEPQVEAKPEDQPNTENENNIPFNKHPRWKQMQEERDELRKKVEELETSVQSVESRIPVQEQAIEVPTWFQMAVSNDVNVWKEYKKYSSQEREEIKKEVLAEQDGKKQREQQEVQRWQKYVDESLAKIEASHNVDFSTEQGKSTQNEFVAFMLKRRPTDERGNYDFVNGWQWFQELKQVPQERTEAKKKIAAMSDSSGSSERTGRESVTREDLRGRSWRDFI